MYHLGIDLGGTKIEGVILDTELQEIFRQRIPTERDRGYAVILDKLTALYETMRRRIDGVSHTFGIGTPGALSLRNARIKNSNTRALIGRPLKEDLEARIGRRVVLENDANCFALAEARLGAGRGKGIVFGVIMGTGCGGGLVIQGKLHIGLQRIAGEWGHASIDPAGPRCYCGHRGCVETLLSGGGLERRFREETGLHLPLPEIVARFRAGGEVEARFIRRFLSDFGRALANLIDILDPDLIVLGGGVSNIEELYTEGIAQVERFVFSDSLETPIVRNTLGDSAGVLGAALIGAERGGLK
ncbi:MAG: ROK family protein [Deltaproteobacteria bacterium]|nr:MAG: ROK family protein [Deltaproteobacteria bacterium]